MNDALAWITPDWPAPARVRAVTTTRNGPGASQPPHERFNLGANVGEDPGVTAANRASLLRALALPSVPSWYHPRPTGAPAKPAMLPPATAVRSARE